MKLQTEFFFIAFLFGFFYVFWIFYRKKVKLNKINRLIKFSLSELEKKFKVDFIDEEGIKEITRHFEKIRKNAKELLTYESSLRDKDLYYYLRVYFHIYTENKQLFLASKETIQKLMSFIYEKALKPHIFKNWWFTDKDKWKKFPDNTILPEKFGILNNEFENWVISNYFLQSYTLKVITYLDISSEDKLINNFFSEKDNWPKWIENTREIKITELPSGKIEGNVRGVFWLVTDSIANRIRYKLWEKFTTYLLDYFDLKSADISKWKNIEKVQETIYENPQTCFKLPKFIKPVIKEILEIAKKERKEKYQKFLNLDKI